MRFIAPLLLLASGVPLAAAAQNSAPAPAPATAAFSTNSDLGILLDNASTKAVLDKYIPEVISNDQITLARSMPLRALQPYVGDLLSDEKLAKIDADLAKIPAK